LEGKFEQRARATSRLGRRRGYKSVGAEAVANSLTGAGDSAELLVAVGFSPKRRQGGASFGRRVEAGASEPVAVRRRGGARRSTGGVAGGARVLQRRGVGEGESTVVGGAVRGQEQRWCSGGWRSARSGAAGFVEAPASRWAAAGR